MTTRLFSVLLGVVLATCAATAAEPAVIKVLPHLLDREGRHTKSPSLFDRDVYQTWLRENPDQQSGLRYDVQWKSGQAGEFVLKLELLGRVVEGRPLRKTVEQPVTVKGGGTRWTGVEFTGDDFREFGKIVAWRITLWRGGTELAKQQSFLWD